MKKISFFPVIFLLALAGCTSSNTTVTPTLAPTIVPATATPLPTPAAPGETVTWGDLLVTMDSPEITNSYMTDFGSLRAPSAGQKFLWVHVRLENSGANEIDLPAPENFSVLYADSEFKPTYAHRQGYPDYTDLATPLFPGQSEEAWLRFDIPDTAQMADLLFVFMPESVQVSVSPSMPGYPWGGERPVFVWACQP